MLPFSVWRELNKKEDVESLWSVRERKKTVKTIIFLVLDLLI